MERNGVHNNHTCVFQYPVCYVGSYMCLHSKVHRSMLLVSLHFVQYSMCLVTHLKVHYAMLLLLCGKVRYAMLARLWCYILKCNVASFITLCSIFYVPSDKFQSVLCYADPSLVLRSKMQSNSRDIITLSGNSSMPLVVAYQALLSRSNVLF